MTSYANMAEQVNHDRLVCVSSVLSTFRSFIVTEKEARDEVSAQVLFIGCLSALYETNLEVL